METTHRRDQETGNMVQIVTPERLREILDADGDDYERPSDFGPDDEWDVEQTTSPAKRYNSAFNRAVREQFPGRQNAGLRQEIRRAAEPNLAPHGPSAADRVRYVAKRCALTAEGAAKLELCAKALEV